MLSVNSHSLPSKSHILQLCDQLYVNKNMLYSPVVAILALVQQTQMLVTCLLRIFACSLLFHACLEM